MRTPANFLTLTLVVTTAFSGFTNALASAPRVSVEDGNPGAVAASPSGHSALRDELLQMAAEDQRVRKTDGPALTREQLEDMQRVDRRNEARLKEIVAQHGWPGKDLVGEEAASKAWLLVQHSRLEFQEKCLPTLERAVAAGQARARDYAYLLDRVKMRRGEPQVYGTQFRTLDGDTWVYPIAEPDAVEARRRSVGLPPLAEQIEKMGLGRRGPQFNETLRAELAAMAAEERRSARTVVTPDEAGERKRLQSARGERLKKIIEQHGWPGRSLVGTDGAFNAWLLVQNCGDEAFIEKCLPLLERAVAAGEANARGYAYLLDTVRLSQGQPQLYGTQLTSDAQGRLVLHPIENRTEVNERRRSVGLEPIEDYERRMHAGRN